MFLEILFSGRERTDRSYLRLLVSIMLSLLLEGKGFLIIFFLPFFRYLSLSLSFLLPVKFSAQYLFSCPMLTVASALVSAAMPGSCWLSPGFVDCSPLPSSPLGQTAHPLSEPEPTAVMVANSLDTLRN
ncbi:hypothetical protein F5X96DRAFT_113822 [Biscogniauxia mediterranea]|nr:hypothetical protein F5X96DRAFT_113822 [Biscogniauxia mediterranea]